MSSIDSIIKHLSVEAPVETFGKGDVVWAKRADGLYWPSVVGEKTESHVALFYIGQGPYRSRLAKVKAGHVVKFTNGRSKAKFKDEALFMAYRAAKAIVNARLVAETADDNLPDVIPKKKKAKKRKMTDINHNVTLKNDEQQQHSIAENSPFEGKNKSKSVKKANDKIAAEPEAGDDVKSAESETEADEPKLSEYEKVRLRNIEEREAAMRMVLEFKKENFGKKKRVSIKRTQSATVAKSSITTRSAAAKLNRTLTDEENSNLEPPPTKNPDSNDAVVVAVVGGGTLNDDEDRETAAEVTFNDTSMTEDDSMGEKSVDEEALNDLISLASTSTVESSATPAEAEKSMIPDNEEEEEFT